MPTTCHPLTQTWTDFQVESCPHLEVDGIVVDTETGGPLRGVGCCALLEVAAVAIDRHRRPITTVEMPDGRVVTGRFRLKILPESGLIVADEAVAINGYDRDRWRRAGAQDEAAVLTAFGSWARAMTAHGGGVDWIAHEATFDREYLDAAWDRSMSGRERPWADRHGWSCSRQAHRMWLRLVGARGASASLRAAATRIGYWTERDADDSHHDALADAYAAAAIWWWTLPRLTVAEMAAC